MQLASPRASIGSLIGARTRTVELRVLAMPVAEREERVHPRAVVVGLLRHRVHSLRLVAVPPIKHVRWFGDKVEQLLGDVRVDRVGVLARVLLWVCVDRKSVV